MDDYREILYNNLQNNRGMSKDYNSDHIFYLDLYNYMEENYKMRIKESPYINLWAFK